jgi:hypothetical protein
MQAAVENVFVKALASLISVFSDRIFPNRNPEAFEARLRSVNFDLSFDAKMVLRTTAKRELR